MKRAKSLPSFSAALELIGRRHDLFNVFDDFLTFVVCALSMGQKENEYLKTAKKYTAEEMTEFSELFALLIVEMDNDGKGLKDVLGEYFNMNFANSRTGQYFTPENLCLMMAQILNVRNEPGPVYDPACGSGRMFLNYAKENRHTEFYGVDISLICCKMALINLCLNGLNGHIAWGNSLNDEFWCEWIVKKDVFTGCPFIMELDSKEDNKVLNVTNNNTDIELNKIEPKEKMNEKIHVIPELEYSFFD